jgi:hypothetical protein
VNSSTSLFRAVKNQKGSIVIVGAANRHKELAQLAQVRRQPTNHEVAKVKHLSQGAKTSGIYAGKELLNEPFSDYLHLRLISQKKPPNNASNLLIKRPRRQRVCAMDTSYSHILLSDQHHTITMPKVDYKIPKNARGGRGGTSDGQPGCGKCGAHGGRGAPGRRGGGGQVGSTEWAKSKNKRTHATGLNAENPYFKLEEPGNPHKNFPMNLSTWRLVIPATLKSVCGALLETKKTGTNKLSFILINSLNMNMCLRLSDEEERLHATTGWRWQDKSFVQNI